MAGWKEVFYFKLTMPFIQARPMLKLSCGGRTSAFAVCECESGANTIARDGKETASGRAHAAAAQSDRQLRVFA